MLWRLFLASVCVTLQAWGEQFFVPFRPAVYCCIYACAFTCGRSFTVCSGWGVLSFWSFLVFSPTLPPSSPFSFFSLQCFIVYFIIYYYYYSTELPALCDGCLGWGWVWRAGLVAGLRVGQAFGMFLLPGFGVGSSSPWVSGHPTFMCDSGVNYCYYYYYYYFTGKCQRFLHQG